MNYIRDYMKDVKKIRQTVTDAYNANQMEQYETSKVAYIKEYYKDYGTRKSSDKLPQIDESFLDAEFE